MLELFLCSGQIDLIATPNYKDIHTSNNNGNKVVLYHKNIGGHYVI